MEYDLLIVGGGAAGMSCALVVGSGLEKEFAKDKKVGSLMHQKTSDLQNALFNNVLGLPPATKGIDILKQGPEQLEELYPNYSDKDIANLLIHNLNVTIKQIN